MTTGEDVHATSGNGDQADAHEFAEDGVRVRERVVSRECAACGREIYYLGRGRVPRYCSGACRQRAWALRRAEQQLAAGADPRPRVVREVVERTVERVGAPPAPAAVSSSELDEMLMPNRARDWVNLLGELRRQLANPNHALAHQHHDHARLYTALLHAVTALGKAHPGGLDRLANRRR